ncbi:hypothetical protein N0M98_32325 [Paenibacillus doosanensis]|uniref:hypothetical protein n=1 Tax=Paenibacillus doosanensis TaxID=1229154 RepID=UPI00217F6AF2|nr:hypothetical protein [Paenibacillus doosanensis]MCS7464774.1 hypothetical protein [Paenibacillus doosanensis]
MNIANIYTKLARIVKIKRRGVASTFLTLKKFYRVKTMIKRTLLCFAFLGCLTACNNGHAVSLSNNRSPDLEVKQTEAVKSDNLGVSNHVNNEKTTSLIPTGWHILVNREQPVKATGDLNNDGIQDVAMVIEKTVKSEKAPPRSLLIAFGNKDSTFSLSIIAENVVLPADAGGVFGDPFDSLTIDRGSVVVSDFGGSSSKWYNRYRFRFQDNDWYLIGATMGSSFPVKNEMGNDEDDYNLLTGDFISKRTIENGEVKITKGNRGKKKLVKLKEFDIGQM